MSKGPIEVSATELIAAGLLVGGLGALIGGWTVGRFSTNGNMADWIAALGGVAAAIGTFSIGIGANRYAREAYLQRTHEESERARHEKDDLARRYEAILIKLERTTFLKRVFEEVGEGKGTSEMEDNDLYQTLQILEGALPKLTWSIEESVLLSYQAQSNLANIENNLRGYELFVKSAIASYAAGKQEKFHRQVAEIQDCFIDLANDATDMALWIAHEMLEQTGRETGASQWINSIRSS